MKKTQLAYIMYVDMSDLYVLTCEHKTYHVKIKAKLVNGYVLILEV